MTMNGSSSSIAVEPTPHDQEAVGSNPIGCLPFFTTLSLFTSLSLRRVPLNRSLEEVQHLIFYKK